MTTETTLTLRQRVAAEAERRRELERGHLEYARVEEERAGTRSNAEFYRKEARFEAAAADALEFYAAGNVFTDGPMALIVAEAERLDMPQAYVADLFFHDRRTMTRYEERRKEIGVEPAFVWVLRETGTHLMDAYGLYAVRMTQAAYEMLSDRVLYVYEDGRLRETTLEGAIGFIQRVQSNRTRTQKAQKWGELAPY